ncbi:dihydrolipoyl dehydrogenase family protein [Cellulomonas bogoriensis]|uniref:Pyridine nucleotide-disulfide oxidoreductase n=1 Tax=Cellulomonas bogoriensis 69B4 = DSM 16987 TaxID=1386082 RepID=A0A0A0C219_9CELL|nr:NAD(P)/FAD-dependent oxidoreductase [Cellulomonas bogoriensis]KGM14200.1 pyridine nucleotide-disulfide oxidoreductase [Cellulomonas bogoriensis 69B4 = DSM 16987]
MIDTFDVLVVGAGPAGTSAALTAAGLGARVGVVEAGRTGGTCVNTGCVPTRVLAKTARLMREVRSAQDFGISVTGQRLDWDAAVARVRSTVERVREAKGDVDRFADAGVQVLTGRARFTSPHELDVTSGDGSVRRVRAESVVLCVGGHSRRLPVPGAELATMPEEVLDLPALPRRVAVIGAGNTGAQLVTVFNAFGSEVTLLEVAPRILAQTDADVSAHVERAFGEQGVRVVTSVESVTSLERTDGGIRLSWTVAGVNHDQVVDAVVMCTGWPAAIEDLGLDAAGVRSDRGRVPVDEYLASNVGHVYVAGDANGVAMLVQAARAEAEAAARNAVLGTTVRAPHRLLPAGGFTDPDYADVGLTEEQARERDERCVSVLVPYDSLERPVIDDRTRGFLKLVADRRREHLLGAHAVGENAVEVIQAVTTAMAAGVDVATLAKVEFAYPTYSAAIGAAARAMTTRAARHASNLNL